MQAETEELLEWASRKLGVRFRDPGERGQRAFAELVDSGFAPESTTASAISILLHYQPGEPLAAPFLTAVDLREIEQARVRESVIARLQTLPDLPLNQRTGTYHELRQEADGDPWLLQRVSRAAGLVVGNVGTIEPDDPLRLLVLLPSEAVLKRAAPPPGPRPIVQEEIIRPSRVISRTPVGTLFNPNLTPWQCVLIVLAFLSLGFLLAILDVNQKSNRSKQGNNFTNEPRINDDHSPSLHSSELPKRDSFTAPNELQHQKSLPIHWDLNNVRRGQGSLKPRFPSLPTLPASPDPKPNDLPSPF